VTGRLRRGLVLPALLLLAWWLASRAQLVNPHLLAPPARVLAEARRLLAGELWLNLGASLARDLAGLLLGAAAGLLLGTALGLLRGFDRLFGPTFHAVKQVAVFAWIPLISLWFGYGEPAKLVAIALAAFWPMALNTCDGIRAVAPEHLEVARTLRFSPWQLWRRVLLPAAAPAIFAGLRLALVTTWIATIGAEYFLAIGPGIGRLLIEGREQFRMDRVLLGVALTGAVGFALSALAGRLETHLLRWRRQAF
jgi:sulfonate transport system permease protein